MCRYGIKSFLLFTINIVLSQTISGSTGFGSESGSPARPTRRLFNISAYLCSGVRERVPHPEHETRLYCLLGLRPLLQAASLQNLRLPRNIAR
jgi:hypothetical protein